MSAGTASVKRRGWNPVEAIQGVVRDNTWTLGLLAFLVVLLVFTRFVNPHYDLRSLASTATSVLVLALAAVAQAVVVMSQNPQLGTLRQYRLDGSKLHADPGNGPVEPGKLPNLGQFESADGGPSVIRHGKVETTEQWDAVRQLAQARVSDEMRAKIAQGKYIAFVVAPLFVLMIAVAASVIPARKTMRVDPMSTLRYE